MKNHKTKILHVRNGYVQFHPSTIHLPDRDFIITKFVCYRIHADCDQDEYRPYFTNVYDLRSRIVEPLTHFDMKDPRDREDALQFLRENVNSPAQIIIKRCYQATHIGVPHIDLYDPTQAVCESLLASIPIRRDRSNNFQVLIQKPWWYMLLGSTRDRPDTHGAYIALSDATRRAEVRTQCEIADQRINTFTVFSDHVSYLTEPEYNAQKQQFQLIPT